MFLKTIAVLILGWVVSVPAAAQPPPEDVVHVEITFHTGCGTPPGPFLFDSGQTITLDTIDACWKRINIWVDDAEAHDIGVVNLIPDDPQDPVPEYLEVFIGEGEFPYNMAQSDAGARDLGGISTTDLDLLEVTRLAGHITGDLEGNTVCGKLYRIDVGLLRSTLVPVAWRGV